MTNIPVNTSTPNILDLVEYFKHNQNKPAWFLGLMKILIICVVCTSTYYFPKLGWWAADTGISLFGYKQFSIGWDIVHHTVQMLPPLLIMLLCISRVPLAVWGITFRPWKQNRALILKFCIGFLICFPLGKGVFLFLSGSEWVLDFDPQLKSAWSVIAFRLVLPGISEELLFRAFPMTLLLMTWKAEVSLGTLEIPVAGIITALLFAVAHVGFDLVPFQITYYNSGQLFFALIFGMAYATVFYKTKSILVPICMHNCIDGVGTLIDFVARYLGSIAM